MSTYPDWAGIVETNVVYYLSLYGAISAYAIISETKRRSFGYPPAPEFPPDVEAADSPMVLVSAIGKNADEMIACGEYGVKVAVDVQVVYCTAFNHDNATVKAHFGELVTGVERGLRSIHGRGIMDAEEQNERQIMVEVLGTGPITYMGQGTAEVNAAWMQQTVSAVVTVIGG